jgi:hypothetical protein
LVTELAGQAGVELPAGSDAERAGALVTALAERGGAGIPLTIVIDGLDESASPGQLADHLIVPVAGPAPGWPAAHRGHQAESAPPARPGACR